MKVLVAIDLSEASQRILEAVKRLFAVQPVELWLVHVGDPEPAFMGYDAGPETQRDAIAADFHKAHQALQSMAEGLRADGIDCSALLVQGEYAETILVEADRLDCELVVVGSHGKGMARQLLLGSTSERVLRQSKRPVLVIPTNRHH